MLLYSQCYIIFEWRSCLWNGRRQMQAIRSEILHVVPSLEVLWLILLCSLSLVQPNSLRSRRTNYIGWTRSLYTVNIRIHTFMSFHLHIKIHSKIYISSHVYIPNYLWMRHLIIFFISFDLFSSLVPFHPETGIIEIQCNMATSRINKSNATTDAEKRWWRCGWNLTSWSVCCWNLL